MKEINLGNRIVYNYSKPYIIAEIGANHNGDMNLAKIMIDSAVQCGADSVKFQSWTPNSLVSKSEYDKNQEYHDSKKKHFGSLKEMVDKYYLRDEQHFELKEYCDLKGIEFNSTPFSVGEADLLDKCNVPFYKVASSDLTNSQLLSNLAERGKPMVLSTGMATIGEIDTAIELVFKKGCSDLALLHCIALYPPAMEDINLNNITMLQQTFGLPVGFSDHSFGFAIPLASVALGACIIEKHFTTDKNLPGWDHEISADPMEMEIICRESANIALATGSYQRVVSKAEQEKKLKFRRSIVVTKDLPEGHILRNEDLTSKRPGTGISPELLDNLVGRELNRSLDYDSLVSWNDIR